MNKAMIYHTSQSSKRSQSGFFNEAHRKGEVIHSGHFMISSVADDQDDDIEDIDHNRDSPIHHEQSIMISRHGYNFSDVAKEPKNTYQFGPLPSNQITIDASLARLFQCMSLAYQGGKVVSPKWKNFKGLKLTVKDKIRLNNAIWRTWHIQYVMRKRKEHSIIQFVTPLEVDVNSHTRPEAVVMEGKYWKRRIETVVEEYKKWRAFFTEKLRLSNYPGLVGSKWATANESLSSNAAPSADRLRSVDDTTLHDFSDTLFSSLSQQPFQFPNPREIAMHATNSDIMQPGLLQLQPAVDDYMDFDPFQDLLNPPKKPVVYFSGSSNQCFTQASNDVFAASDLSHLLEPCTPIHHQHVQRTNGVHNSQPMDMSDGFGVHQQNQVTLLRQPVSTVDPVFSSINALPSNCYPANVLHPQQQSNVQHLSAPAANDQVPMVQNFTPLPVKQYSTMNGSMQQQQQQQFHKHNHSANAATANVLLNSNGNIQHQQSCPFSRVGSNNPSNKIIYSQPQATQPINTFQQDQFMKQHYPTNSMDVNPVQTQAPLAHGIPDFNYVNPGMPPLSQQQSQATQPHQHVAPNDLDMASTNVNMVLLKDFLTNKAAAATNIPVNNKRKSNGLSRNLITQQAQQQQIAPVVAKKAHILPQQCKTPPAVNVPAPFPVAEKRKSAEDFRTYPEANNQRSQSTSHSTPAPSPVKAILEDVDMEQISLESLSPFSQDHEIVQTETLQRQGSFSTEQKRRVTIKMGFTRLQKLLPGSSSQNNTKASKASLMNKAAQHIKALQAERTNVDEEIQNLKKELENLQLSISSSQQMLPATGAPVTKPRKESRNRFKTWSRHRTKQEWKFYFFSVVVRTWFDSYQRSVSLQGHREFARSISEWLDKHCSLRELRQNVVQSLQVISLNTSILTNPSLLQQQIENMVRRQEVEDARQSGTS